MIDRWYALEGSDGSALKGKQLVLILAYGDSDPFESGAINAIRSFQDMCRYLKWGQLYITRFTGYTPKNLDKQLRLWHNIFALPGLSGKAKIESKEYVMTEILLPQKIVEIAFSLEPAYNAIASLSLLDMAEDFSGLNEWVYRTRKALSPEQLRANQIVLQDATVYLADVSWPCFPAWVDDLVARRATNLRDRALLSWHTGMRKTLDREIPSPAELLADRAAYLSLVEESDRRKGTPFDRSLWKEVHSLLNDPQARKDLIVTHFRTMWDQHLAPEWERNLPMLEESIAAFESLDLSGLTAAEALSRVVLRAQIPQESMDWLAGLDQITFIPSAHTGPYLINLSGHSNTSVRFVFGARIPKGAPARLPALSRSELLMRLSALANDTRLQILELLAQKGELGTPEVIAQLELSQSAASRHLEHLTATGYLTARSRQGANLYQLNPDRIDYTFGALKDFLGGR